jgi:hypothetical protein
MAQSSEEVRVRDLLRSGELPSRPVLGAVTCKRIGARFWERPNVAISGRLYRKYGVEDPWDPDSPNKGRKIGLGPVGLRLTEPRRQVAPHLKPKVPVQKKKPQAVDPLARWRKTTTSKPKPAPAPAAPPPPERTRLFGGPTRHALRGKLPVRPDIEGSPGPEASKAAPETVESRSQPSPPGPAPSRSGSGRRRMRGRQVTREAPRIIPPTRKVHEDPDSDDS